jgi:hypothetical protein
MRLREPTGDGFIEAAESPALGGWSCIGGSIINAPVLDDVAAFVRDPRGTTCPQ